MPFQKSLDHDMTNLFRVFKEQRGFDFVKWICHSTCFLMDFFSFPVIPSAGKLNVPQEGSEGSSS